LIEINDQAEGRRCVTATAPKAAIKTVRPSPLARDQPQKQGDHNSDCDAVDAIHVVTAGSNIACNLAAVTALAFWILIFAAPSQV